MKSAKLTYSANDWLILLGTLAIALFFASFPFFSDSDTYWHLANGREMIGSGHIAAEELFSYTHFGEKFENHEWLAQVIFYLIWRDFGAIGLFGFKLLVVSLVVILLYRTQRILGVASWLAGVLCIFAVYAGLIRYSERPELFSLLNVTLLGFLLYSFRAKQVSNWALWSIPLILVVWDWLHGAVYGLVFFTLFVLGENAKRYFAFLPQATSASQASLTVLNRCFAVAIIAMLLNPFGLTTYGIFVGILNGDGAATSKINEFSPVTWKEFTPYILLFLWAALLSLRQIRRLDVTQLLLLVIFGFAALRYNRATGVAAIVLVPIIGSLTMSAAQNSSSSTGKKLHTLSVILAATYIFSSGYVTKILKASPRDVGDFYYPASRTAFGYDFEDYVYPAGAVQFIKAVGLRGDLYNSGQYGGYLAFHITPERKIFQYNLPIIFGDTARFLDHPDEIAKSNITYAIADLAESNSAMFPSSDWARVYCDPFSVLLLRRVPQNEELIRQYEIRYFFPGFSDDRLLAMSRQAELLPRLAFEMGVYLAYRRDERIANLWAEILASSPSLKAQPRFQQLLQQVERRNTMQVLDKLVDRT